MFVAFGATATLECSRTGEGPEYTVGLGLEVCERASGMREYSAGRL
jgi:hypothetical protein